MSKTKGRPAKLVPAPAPRAPRDESVPDVEAEDEVEIKPWCFQPDGIRMTPIELYKIGWPNRFRVLDVQEHKGQRFLVLDPCCNWMEDHANSIARCGAHPAMYFSKIEVQEVVEPEKGVEEENRVPSPEDRYTSVDTPWGSVLKVEYLEDDRTPVIKLRFAGGKRPFTAAGEVARFMRDRAVELGLL